MRCARDDGTHAHTNRDAHLASLTPLIGEAQVRGCARRARAAQRRSRGATEARGVHLERHVMKAAYILHIPQYRVIFFHIMFICLVVLVVMHMKLYCLVLKLYF